MSDPISITCGVSPCVIELALTTPILNLDPEAGVLISSAVLLVWAVGYGVRSVIRVLNSDSVSTNESE